MEEEENLQKQNKSLALKLFTKNLNLNGKKEF